MSEDDLETVKIGLFYKTMKHDLALINEYDDNLEERVARLLTNDMGETLRTEVSYALIQEFKKFMYLVALDILQNKVDDSFKQNTYEYDSKTKTSYFTSSYHPPYMIDLVWRFIIQEGEIYTNFCEMLCGGYIDRANPLKDMKATLTRYSSARKALEENDTLLKPYWGLWPKLDSTDQISLDYEYDSFLHMHEKLSQLIEFRNLIQEQEIDDLDVNAIKVAIQEWREKSIVEVDDFAEHQIQNDIDLEEYDIEKEVDLEEMYQELINYEFHENFRKSICKMFNLDEAAGRQLLREYKNFLLMYYLTDHKCAPSFEIDSFWDLHYASTKDYRDFCFEIFGEFLPSKNYDYTDSGIRKRAQDYKISLSLYEELFGEEPNHVFWESAVDLVINSKNGFQHVSLFKYASLCIYHVSYGHLEYKNTFRRSKDKYYKKFDEDTISIINRVSIYII